MAEHKERHRPVLAGISVGTLNIGAGTTSLLVRKDGDVFRLSNYHVLCVPPYRGVTSIIQPGVADGGTIRDKVGTLEDFIPIKFEKEPTPCAFSKLVAKVLNAISKGLRRKTRFIVTKEEVAKNEVDCAIYRPDDPQQESRVILGIGEPMELQEPTPAMSVVKSGRSTGVTEGQIIAVGVDVKVNYGTLFSPKYAYFKDQILIEGKRFLQPGDSGSAVLEKDTKKPVGLLFAGSPSGTHGWANPMSKVFEMLGLKPA